MHARTIRLLVAVLLTAVSAAPLSAQRISIDSVTVADTTNRHSIRLSDGSTLIGLITAVSGDSVRIRLAGGELSIARGTIVEVQQFSSSRIRGGQYWFANPHATRLLFSSTAFPLEKGTGYYSNTWLAFHTFAVGLTDDFTMGGGLLWFPGIPLESTSFYLLPKFTVVNGESAKVAVGALVGLLPFGPGDESASAGILYGVGTTGSRDSHLSLGLGWGYAGGEIASNPIVMVGGQRRTSRRVSFITENWIFPVDGETELILSGGLRFLGEGLTVDLAWVRPSGSAIGIPWVGFAFKF